MQFIGVTTQQLISALSHTEPVWVGKQSEILGICSTGICKCAKYSVQRIEEWQSNGRTGRGAIATVEAVLTRKRETEGTLKLLTNPLTCLRMLKDA